ncbi:MAG: hypothetical protein FGM37_08445 [Phycisphaerales bacterium]|nr:hypothetical protein [Phycisphaerales bacterium]
MALAQNAKTPPAANAPDAPAPALAAAPVPSVDAAAPVDAPGLHNVVAFGRDVLSGSMPEGDAGFDSLKAWGVQTIISVDGAVPDLARAKSRGLRYVHLPIGYHGFDDARKLELSRAVRDLPRPVYIHCHHGKHRSAGAAGTVTVTLGWLTPDQAVARMKVAGASPSYTGLYRCTTEAVKVADAALDAADAGFPEVSRPAGLVKGMVAIDLTWDNLKAVQKAGWTVPPDHPDLVPAAEAGRLADTLRLLRDDEAVKARPVEFQALMARNADQAQALEDLLAKLAAGARPSAEDAERMSAIASQITATCKACHSAYRD